MINSTKHNDEMKMKGRDAFETITLTVHDIIVSVEFILAKQPVAVPEVSEAGGIAE